ncbi:hypothetical protein BAL199_07853 [alpha proteobacterium BAL199]|nr:hypothetical protein BAL199_07853 [alpha proteobacterium BAL199]
MSDAAFENGVLLHPDGVEIACPFQSLIECRDRIGGIGPEEAATKVATSVAGDHRIKDVPPAVGAVDVAIAQGAAFQHAELVEQEVGMIAVAVEMPVPRRSFLIAMRRADRAVHVQHDILEPAFPE